MINPALSALLIDMIAKTIPASAGQSESPRETRLAIARTLLEAWSPADAMEAMQAARAIAGHLAAMDSFARAAGPGVSDEKAVRLRGNAVAAGRVFDNLLRTLRRKRQPASADPQPRATGPANAVSPAPVRQRPELPSTIPELPGAVIQAARRTVLASETALTSAKPTVLASG